MTDESETGGARREPYGRERRTQRDGREARTGGDAPEHRMPVPRRRKRD